MNMHGCFVFAGVGGCEMKLLTLKIIKKCVLIDQTFDVE